MTKTKLIILLSIGLVLMVVGFPVGFMGALSINGCCGAPSPDVPVLGYLPGIGMGLTGIVIVLFSVIRIKRLASK